LAYDRNGSDIHLLIPLISGEIQYSLANSYHPSLKQRIHHLLSSIKNGRFDIQGYLDMEEQNNSDNIKYDANDLLDVHQKFADLAIQCIKDTEKIVCEGKEPTITDTGATVSLVTLNRLIASYQSVLILIRCGFHLETQVLFRLILEQLAYAYACKDLTEDEKIAKISPSGGISILKKDYQLIGEFYGELSNAVHFKENGFNQILTKNKEKGGININIRSGKKSKIDFLPFFYLVVIYIDICKKIYEKYSDDKTDELKCLLQVTTKIFNVYQEDMKKEINAGA
jgi:hypothetical protein